MSSALALAGCGGAPQPDSTTEEIDARAKMPAPDPAFIDFQGGEWVLQPGDDKMFCTHLRYDGKDVAWSNLATDQGEFGHHAVLLAAKEPLPPGTTVDCTDAAEMKKYDAYTIGDQELPAGHGVFLEKGKPMVLQSHYINAGKKRMRVRDVVRLRKIAVDQVKTWASMYVTNTLDFMVPPGESRTVTFDCTIKNDVNLLIVGGHMHEWGKKFELAVGPDEHSLKTIYLADPWRAEFRDVPPINMMFSKPMPMPKGTVVRTSCTWDNTTETDLIFPHEMCASFGYIAGSKQSEICSVELK